MKPITDKKSCFVIMPFTKAIVNNVVLDKNKLDYIYNDVIHKAVSSYKKGKKKIFGSINRNDSQIGSIINNIIGSLNQVDLVIADLSGLNANVMYELGVRHTLRRGTIIITQELNEIPSDLRDYFLVKYEFSENVLDQQKNYLKFEQDLHKAIEEIFITEKFDSPVLNYLKGKEKYWREEEINRFWHNKVVFEFIVDSYFEIQDIIKVVNDSDQVENQEHSLAVLSSLLSNISSAIGDVRISAEAIELYGIIVVSKNLITEMSKDFILGPSIDDYFKKLGTVVPDVFDEVKSTTIQSVVNKQYLNSFLLPEGKVEYLTFLDVFTDGKDFHSLFLLKLDEYLDAKAKEFGITDDELKKRFNE